MLIAPRFKMDKCSSKYLLTYNFPAHFYDLTESFKTLSVEGPNTCEACVVRVANWQKIKAWSKGRPLWFQREVCRTVKHCAHYTFYSSHGKTSYLCKAHFDELYKKNVFMTSDIRPFMSFVLRTQTTIYV